MGKNGFESSESTRGIFTQSLRSGYITTSYTSKRPAGTVTVFPHVISRLGTYLSALAGLNPGDSMAYLVAPPMEATLGLDAALKVADVRAVKVFTPPTETNFAASWLAGDLYACEAAATAFAATVVEIAANPRER